MAFIFEKLLVYPKPVDFADAVCSATESFPRGCGFLVDQLKRASPSIAALAIAGLCLASWRVRADEPRKVPNGDAFIQGKAGSSDIVITTTERLAGAIHSLKWNGKEFIDSLDHGRQLQSAASFDCALAQEFWPECFNPTEAGSRADGIGGRSSSKLLHLHADGRELRTIIQMAYWLAPGERSSDRPALNKQVLSRHQVSKRVKIGHKNLPHVIEYEVTFSIPDGERHTYAQFEALTGYMPAEFGRFWTFLPASGELKELDDGPGEQEYPMVFATGNGFYAMGIFSPAQPSAGYEKAGYGRFRFEADKVVKWNCVFRERNAQGIAPGQRNFPLFVVVGKLDEVKQSLAELVAEFSGPLENN